MLTIFSFLAMMLPINQSEPYLFKYILINYSASTRILPIIDNENLIKNSDQAIISKLKSWKESLRCWFYLWKDEGKVLKSINLIFAGGKMTSLVGHSGSGKSNILNLLQDFMIFNQEILKLMANQFISQKT